MFEPTPLEESSADGRGGVERAIVTTDLARSRADRRIARVFLGKLITSAVIDPTTGMSAVRLLDRLVLPPPRRTGCRLSGSGRPPNDKVTSGVRASGIELTLRSRSNTGIPVADAGRAVVAARPTRSAVSLPS